MVYGSRTELEAAREAAWTYNEAVTQTLKQVDQLTLLGKSLFPRVPAAETHVYFPTVCDMPTLLSHEACLSDVFVLEFSEALLASKPLKKSSTSANEDATPRVSRAREKVMLASEWYGLSSSRKHMELLLRAVREWLTLLCDNRLVLSWDLTDYAQDCIPRIAIAVSYEHTDLDKVLRRSKGAPLVSLTAAEDVTTLEATLTRALESLRTAGWFLIRQENHCAWDRKRKVRAQEEESFRDLSDSIKEIQRESLPPHFQNTQEAEQQTVVSHIGDKTNRRTTSAVWGAHLIQRRDGLHLRRGQFVVLDNGRMGRIVDFLPPPKNIWQINESPTADFRVYCPTGAGKKYYEPFLQWWKLDRTRVQQTASLPPFLETAEKSVYPLVELPHTRERMLVLPTRVVVYPVQYPTLCFVSVSEQLRTRAQREALEDDTTTPEEWMERFMGDSRELQPVSWYLEDSSGRAHVKCLELPLSRLFLDTPGSYYLSSVFREHKFPEISPVQCRWRTLHHTTGEEAGVEQLCDARYHERSISCRSPMGCPFPTPFKEAHLGTFERLLLFPTTTPSPELLRCCAASALVPRKILSSLAFKRKDFFRK
ncbi:hypothetical protein AGDE_14740 [Angomonas deanei]|nr:hypothetical protein AGDE_14740 [Angomonas deanei]|eukprot:EPY20317.1 hypothetical protein AGDE_14740 [Angomonas deanei]